MYKQVIYTTKMGKTVQTTINKVFKKNAIHFSLKVKFHPQGAKRNNVKTITSDRINILNQALENQVSFKSVKTNVSGMV